MTVSSYSTTAASNTTINALSIAEGCPPGNMNNMGREIMADIASWRAAFTATGGATITGGPVLVGVTGNYNVGAIPGTNCVSSTADTEWVQALRNTAVSTPYGRSVAFSGAAPNNSSQLFDYAEDNSAARYFLRSNGGISNYQANDTNLSDERTKCDIVPLPSYWNKVKAIEVVTFKYNDQTHDDDNIGVIAQQVESVAPEFVDVDGFGETPEDGVPLKAVYMADMFFAALKVIQELQARVEALEA